VLLIENMLTGCYFAVSEGSRRCDRTLKYFQGVAHKCWVLSVDWARDCVTQQQLLAPV